MNNIYELASATVKAMGLDETHCIKVLNELDSLNSQEIYPFLESHFGPSMMIAGSWIPAANKGIDLYDECLKFVQDRFYRARVRKDCSGYYILIVTDPV